MYVSKTARNQGQTSTHVDPHPSVEPGTLAGLPPTLTSLSLGDMILEPDAFDHVADLGALRHLTLQCGPHSKAIATALSHDTARCPQLEAKGCFVSTPNQTNGMLACLEPRHNSDRDALRTTNPPTLPHP